MQLKVKKIIATDFKGLRRGEYEFGDRNIVSGANGTGKTTIADAHFWLWLDKDYSLSSSPEVHPNFMEESMPTVTEIIEIDGEEIEVKKMQQDARTQKQKNEGAPVRIKNLYEINGVPKSQTDFIAELTKRGIDFDKFLLLSHIEVFTSQKSADCRNLLFGMVSDITDRDIAKSIEGCEELVEVLGRYRAEEVLAMAKREKKAADEQLDAIPNQIIGLEKAKEDVDVAALTARREALQAEIDGIKKMAGDNSTAEKERIESEIATAESELKAVRAKADAERLDALGIANTAVSELEIEDSKIKTEIERKKNGVKDAMAQRDRYEKRYNELADEFAEVKAQEFTEENCAYCGQPLPQDKVDDLRKAFEDKQTKRKAQINTEAQDIKNKIQELEDYVHSVSAELKELVQKQYDVTDRLAEAKERKALQSEPVDVTVTVEYKTAWDKLQSLKADLESLSQNNEAWKYAELLVEKGHEMKALNDQIARAGVNDKIDSQIAELKEKKKQVAQDKANAEKVLYQMSLISMEKNKRLTEQVNSHFDLVKFKLFDVQKNGEFKDCCIPMIDGKVFVQSANTALTMIGQLDIIDGLSKFYGQQYPLFVDGAEQFDTQNLNTILIDNQTAFLCVNDDELKVRAM